MTCYYQIEETNMISLFYWSDMAWMRCACAFKYKLLVIILLKEPKLDRVQEIFNATFTFILFVRKCNAILSFVNLYVDILMQTFEYVSFENFS